MTQDCLNEATVVRFLEGELPAERLPAIETHLASCGACANLVTWAAADLHGAPQSLPRSASPPTDALAPGSYVGRYQILNSVGRGGMGEVFAAYHPDLDRRIALKVVHATGRDTAERQARLLREARAIARLSHPNVVSVYDAGTVAGRVYVAMEFVEGETIDRWLHAAPRTWREVLRVFLAAARGLAAAHAAGLVHRDFKPQNVMLGSDGAVRVMDFGLARMTADVTVAATPGTPTDAALLTADQALSHAGLIVGTPAYMPPEQFRGEPADARSDQFSFCVALYEALLGERPFRGENVLSLSLNVTEGEMRPLPAVKQEIPVWVRRPLLRGLRADPAQRHPTMAALIAALERPPATKHRRLLGAGAIVAAVVVGAAFTWQATSRRRTAVEREIAREVNEATRASTSARARTAEATGIRHQAFEAFDRNDRRNGELLWRKARSLLPTIDADFERAERSLETAYLLEPSLIERRAGLAGLRLEHLLFTQDFRLTNRASVLEERLAASDGDGSRRRSLAAAGTLVVRTNPPPSRILLQRYEVDPIMGRRRAVAAGSLPVDRPETSLPPGSYRLLIECPGRVGIAYPFEIRRNERTEIVLHPPAASAVPRGFIYIPPGTFWFGDADEQLRTQFLDTVPIHRRVTGAYLIARYETTYADWIAFLDDIPSAERARHAPAISSTIRGGLLLQRTQDGWRLTIQPSSRRYEASLHEPIVYVGRNRRVSQDWSRFPIGGLSPDDVDRYLAWLRATGRLPGARLCSELEWERAARGGDDRLFPHGDELAEDDANFDQTYDRADGAYGPDEVGAHPDSRSPFDVDDLAGNIMEMVASDVPSGLAVRGGAYYLTAAVARTSNRTPIPRSFRDVNVGLRVCADAEP